MQTKWKTDDISHHTGKGMVMMWWKLAFACTPTAVSKKFTHLFLHYRKFKKFVQLSTSNDVDICDCKTEKSTRREVEEKQRKLIELILTLPGVRNAYSKKKTFHQPHTLNFSRAFVLAKFNFHRWCFLIAPDFKGKFSIAHFACS